MITTTRRELLSYDPSGLHERDEYGKAPKECDRMQV